MRNHFLSAQSQWGLWRLTEAAMAVIVKESNTLTSSFSDNDFHHYSVVVIIIFYLLIKSLQDLLNVQLTLHWYLPLLCIFLTQAKLIWSYGDISHHKASCELSPPTCVTPSLTRKARIWFLFFTFSCNWSCFQPQLIEQVTKPQTEKLTLAQWFQLTQKLHLCKRLCNTLLIIKEKENRV